MGNLTYEYDKGGNRTKTGGSFARTGVPQTISSTGYNAANHQTTFGDKTLTYDNNGNLSSIVDAGGTSLYNWNARNQLTGISGPGVNASFVYDGLGRREKKTINTSLTEFLYDGVNPVQETSGATVLGNILTGLGVDEFLTRTDVAAGTTSSFLPDGLGSALALADSAGTVQTEYTYEPFGRTTLTGAANTSSYQYTGRENDGTGLYYYRARYYSPALQRFISEDPIEFEGGDINLYAYVWNSPSNFSDPYGHFAQVLVPAAIALGRAALYVGTSMGAAAIVDGIIRGMEARGRQGNIRDTGLRDLSDEEVSRRARDRSLSGEERRKYQREEKARGQRNKQKRGGGKEPKGSPAGFPFLPFGDDFADGDDPQDCLGRRKC